MTHTMPASKQVFRFAVRNDRLILKDAAKVASVTDGPSISGIVNEVEYQGTYVRVAITVEGRPDISAQLSESQFDAANYAVGDRVLVSWDPTQASALKTTSSATLTPSKTAA